MLARLAPLQPLKVLVARAGIGYVLLRLLLVVVAALLGEFAGPEATRSLQSPAGVILIAAAVGFADIKRRGESMLWANLGFSAAVAPVLFAAAAIVGELLIAALLR